MAMRRSTFTRPGVRTGDLPVIDVRDRSLFVRERIFVPLWVTALQSILSATFRLLARVVRLAVRHPGQTLALVVVALVWRWAGWLGVTALTVTVLALGLGWRYRWPGSFDRNVTGRARTWRRWRKVYRPLWRDLMDGCGLIEATDAGEAMPQIDHLVSTRGRDDLVLVLPFGQVPDDVTASADALAHGLRAWRVTARTLGRGRVHLVVHWIDPLAEPLDPHDLPAEDGDRLPDHDDPSGPSGGRRGLGRALVRWLTPETVLRRLSGVLVGRTEAGAPWRLNLIPGHHLLVSGTTGSGKSGLLWAILWALADLIRAGWITVTAFDPKYVELRALTATGLGTVHTHVPSMPDELDALVAEMDARCARMTGRKHLPSLAEPVRIVVIDELATLTALADPKARRRVEDALGHLLSRGRAAGFEVILTSVEATKEVVRWRGLCSTRVCYRTDDDGATDLVLGDGARDRGAATELIPEDTPGVAYARIEGRADIARVRTAHITDDHIHALTPDALDDDQGDDQDDDQDDDGDGSGVIALPTPGGPRPGSSSSRSNRSAS